jgi:hypothetical protein
MRTIGSIPTDDANNVMPSQAQREPTRQFFILKSLKNTITKPENGPLS